MINVYLPDVGDGLTVGVYTISGVRIQIDCGSSHNQLAALYKGLMQIKPDAFILSHFHSDHYNGLFKIPFQIQNRLTIKIVFFPRIPDFQERIEFAHCLFAMNYILLGDDSGSMEGDFLSCISKINSVQFEHESLYEGKNFTIGDSNFTALWPPKVISDNGIRKEIKQAISDFNEACQKDNILRKIYETIREKGEIQPYLSDDKQYFELCHREEKFRKDDFQQLTRKRQIPPETERANESLRKATNRLSLAFYEDNRFLFMGDLEGSEIKKVVRNLCELEKQSFFVMITPHHGTHWHKDMLRLRLIYALSSVGAKGFRNVSPDYKRIAETHYLTYCNGDIEIPYGQLWQTRLFRFPYRYHLIGV